MGQTIKQTIKLIKQHSAEKPKNASFSHLTGPTSHQWELGKLDGEEGGAPNHTTPGTAFAKVALTKF